VSHNTRIIYQNINSLCPKSDDKWRATIDQMHHLEADCVGLCETSVNWNNNKTRHHYSQQLTKKFCKSNLVASQLPQLPTKLHIPGGCASITVDDMVNKIEACIEDKYKMGGWTGVKYQIGKEKRLNVITAYRVIDQTVTAQNSLSTNSQQHHAMLNWGIDNVKPRSQFIIDFCEQFEEMCYDTKQLTLLMLDANKCISTPEKDGILDLVETCGLVNIYQSLHDNREEFPTHLNGSKVID
jgi:hypothetical protein